VQPVELQTVQAAQTNHDAVSAVHPGRYSADVDGDFVVFLIGMRINQPLKVRQWLPVAAAMPPMLRALDQYPELGCLGYHSWFGRTTILLQYWRDFESLDRFARDKQLPHLEPWRRFNTAVGRSGVVGVWHETYRVRAGDFEAIYVNMPVFGLAAASRHVPTSRKAQTAAARLGLSRADQPAVAPF
jgi:Monooxygenase af470-like